MEMELTAGTVLLLSLILFFGYFEQQITGFGATVFCLPFALLLVCLLYTSGIYSYSGNYDYNNIRQQLHSESVGMYVISYKDDKNTFDWKYMEDLIDQGVETTDTEKESRFTRNSGIM